MPDFFIRLFFVLLFGMGVAATIGTIMPWDKKLQDWILKGKTPKSRWVCRISEGCLIVPLKGPEKFSRIVNVPAQTKCWFTSPGNEEGVFISNQLSNGTWTEERSLYGPHFKFDTTKLRFSGPNEEHAWIWCEKGVPSFIQ